MNKNKNPMEGEGEGPWRERCGDGIAPIGRSHQRGGERGVEELTMISLVLRFQSPEV